MTAERFMLTFGDGNRKVAMALNFDREIGSDAFVLSFLEQNEIYEPEIVQLMLRVLRQGDHVIDVGANIGYFTVLTAMLVGSSGRVTAYEPGPDNLPTLKENIKLNQLANVTVIEQPVWCREEKVTFYLNSDNRSSHSLVDPGGWFHNIKTRENPNPVEMRAATIDSISTISARNTKLIKIDTEGSEQHVLEGASTFLDSYQPPYIVVELNPWGLTQAGHNERTLRNFMRDFGYEMFFLDKRGNLPTLVPYNTQAIYLNGQYVVNVLFSTIEAVGKAWPEAQGERVD